MALPVMLFVFIAVFAIGFGVARFAASKFATAMLRGQRTPAPEDKTGADIAAEFLTSGGATDVKIVRHNAVVSDYFDPRRRRLYLRSAIYDGRDLAAWAVALHEAAHAMQGGEERAALMWRQTCIRLTRYLPVAAGMLAGLMLIFRKLPGGSRTALGVFLGSCAIALMLNIGTLAIEYQASKRALRWLEERLRKQPAALDRLDQLLQAVALRELGDILHSPRYFFFSALPGSSKLRPDREPTPENESK